MSNWLVRLHPGRALIWKRKFFLGAVAIPWYYHGGTELMQSGETTIEALHKAIHYIRSENEHAVITVEL